MAEEICRQYLEALNEGNLEKILSLFDSDAVVVSPLYGEMPAAKFYKDLFADTSRSETRLLNIFNSVSGSSDMVLHFHYLWTLKNGKTVEFECVDVLEISSKSNKIKRLKIIYDTAPISDDFHENQALP